MSLNKKQADKLKKIAATSSICLALFLCLIKGLAVAYTNSLAILSSMIDSLSDIFASLITFFAIKISTKPASNNYRYGYGKVESLSALFQSLFVAISGLYIFYDSILRFWHPVELKQIDFGFWVAKIPGPVLTLVQVVLTIALIVFAFKELYRILSYAMTLKGGSE